jgi:DNA integrity scanning protein DisA with diadenylate cyclase activity
MIGALFGGVFASPLARAALRYGAIALAVVLFLLSIRRAGERVGRLAERLQTTEKANDVQRRMLEAAARRPRNRDELVDRLRDGGF